MTWNDIVCWVCGKVPVKCYGLTCLRCRDAIYRAYDMERAANGGKLLYIPDDWDGPARPAEANQKECKDCHEWFSVKQRDSQSERCSECRRIYLLAGVHARRARKRVESETRRVRNQNDIWEGFGDF